MRPASRAPMSARLCRHGAAEAAQARRGGVANPPAGAFAAVLARRCLSMPRRVSNPDSRVSAPIFTSGGLCSGVSLARNPSNNGPGRLENGLQMAPRVPKPAANGPAPPWRELSCPDKAQKTTDPLPNQPARAISGPGNCPDSRNARTRPATSEFQQMETCEWCTVTWGTPGRRVFRSSTVPS